MVRYEFGYIGDLGGSTYQPQHFVVDPNKVFRLSEEDFVSKHLAQELSQHGKLRMTVRCGHGPSGLHGHLGFLTPPEPCPEGKDPDQWVLVWDGYELLGLVQLPHPTEYRIQVFGLHGTFYEEYAHEILFTSDVDALTDFPYENETEDGAILRHEWKAFFDQVLVKEFGAESLDGHKWATCPCAFCTSDDEQGVCACPK